MTTCSRNLIKYLKNYYQTKTTKEMSQHDFQKKIKSNDFFLKKIMIKYFFVIWIFHICAKF